MLCEISTTARPRSARRRTRLRTWAVCATPRAAVGSSSMTTLEFQSTALAIATVCRWPPERLATRWRTDFTVRTDSDFERLLGRLLHAALVEHDAAAPLTAEEHVLDDVEVVAQREVLVDDLDAERAGVARRVHGDRVALEEVVAGVDGVGAADALDERRLAGAVVADERGDLAGRGAEVDALEDVDRAEALVDAAQREDRVGRSSVDALLPQSAAWRRSRDGGAGVAAARAVRRPPRSCRYWCCRRQLTPALRALGGVRARADGVLRRVLVVDRLRHVGLRDGDRRGEDGRDLLLGLRVRHRDALGVGHLAVDELGDRLDRRARPRRWTACRS